MATPVLPDRWTSPHLCPTVLLWRFTRDATSSARTKAGSRYGPSATGWPLQAGHDLTIDAVRWSGELVVADDLAPESLDVTVDLGALVVRDGTGGIKPLTDRDKREIAVTARKVLSADRYPEATFTATELRARPPAAAAPSAARSTLAGQSRPQRLQVSQTASRPCTTPPRPCGRPSFGIKPYSAFLGTLKVADAVEVEVDLDSVGTGRGHGMTAPAEPVPAPRRSLTSRSASCSIAASSRCASFAGQAAAVAAACHQMAIRFHQGGKLVVFGTGGSSTDAQHVAVEFVHPVIVGKRALPAISLTSDVATVTGIAGPQRHGRDLLASAALPGRARRYRARHLG